MSGPHGVYGTDDFVGSSELFLAGVVGPLAVGGTSASHKKGGGKTNTKKKKRGKKKHVPDRAGDRHRRLRTQTDLSLNLKSWNI